ncbi:MAG: DUF6691 family protein [Candidatus Sericytochromatia bacterium]
MQGNRRFYLAAFASGLLFSLALGISGMMDPRKVQGFLDLAGRWDPSLTLVMGGAVLMTFLIFPLIFKRKRPLLDDHFALPTATKADARLLIGSALFGTGWAISGMCPGPGLANLASFNPGVLAFVASMLSGFVLYQKLSLLEIRRHSHSRQQLRLESEAFCAQQCVVD